MLLFAIAICVAVMLYQIKGFVLRRRPAAVQPDFGAIASANSSDGIVVQTLDGRILWANPAYLRIMRLTADRVVGQHPLSFCMPPDQRPDAAAIAAFRYDPDDPAWQRLTLVQNQRSDGTLFWNQLSASFHDIPSGQTLAVLSCRDVTEDVENQQALRQSTADLARVAGYDSLTGVANRATFAAAIGAALSDPSLTGRLGLLQIDMDKFKQINDLHGHAAGDAALRHVSATLTAHLRQTDLLARMGGDEFVALCIGISDEAELLRIGRALCLAVQAPFVWDGQEISVSISVGAVMTDAHDASPDHLLQKSDFALYEVKRRGRGDVAIYDRHLHTEAQRRDRLSQQLRHAIDQNALTFFFQPTIDLISGEVSGFEALARWQHPTHGLMHPSVFLPLARDMNLLRHVDGAALGAAARLSKQLDASGFGKIRVGINGSHTILTNTDHLDSLPHFVTRYGVSPDRMVIELAERDVFGDPERRAEAITAMQRLVDLGFHVLIDCFGSGYAGLLHIEDLGVAGFKIEKALIRQLDTAPACERITAMLMTFSKEKAIYCVASGIETAAQAHLVRGLGGTVGQGNYFARAMPQTDVLEWLVNHRLSRSQQTAGA